MACVRYGVDYAGLAEKPRVITVANTNSSLQFDINMTETMLTMGKYRQPIIITPAAMAGKFNDNIDKRIVELVAAYKKPEIDESIVKSLANIAMEYGIGEQYIKLAIN